MKFLEGTRNSGLDFEGDLNLDPVSWFLMLLFIIILFAVCQRYKTNIFSDEPDFSTLSHFNIPKQNSSHGG